MKLAGYIGYWGKEKHPGATAHASCMCGWKGAQDVEGLVRISDVLAMLDALEKIACQDSTNAAPAIHTQAVILNYQQSCVNAEFMKRTQ